MNIYAPLKRAATTILLHHPAKLPNKLQLFSFSTSPHASARAFADFNERGFFPAHFGFHHNSNSNPQQELHDAWSEHAKKVWCKQWTDWHRHSSKLHKERWGHDHPVKENLKPKFDRYSPHTGEPRGHAGEGFHEDKFHPYRRHLRRYYGFDYCSFSSSMDFDTFIKFRDHPINRPRGYKESPKASSNTYKSGDRFQRHHQQQKDWTWGAEGYSPYPWLWDRRFRFSPLVTFLLYLRRTGATFDHRYHPYVFLYYHAAAIRFHLRRKLSHHCGGYRRVSKSEAMRSFIIYKYQHFHHGSHQHRCKGIDFEARLKALEEEFKSSGFKRAKFRYKFWKRMWKRSGGSFDRSLPYLSKERRRKAFLHNRRHRLVSEEMRRDHSDKDADVQKPLGDHVSDVLLSAETRVTPPESSFQPGNPLTYNRPRPRRALCEEMRRRYSDRDTGRPPEAPLFGVPLSTATHPVQSKNFRSNMNDRGQYLPRERPNIKNPLLFAAPSRTTWSSQSQCSPSQLRLFSTSPSCPVGLPAVLLSAVGVLKSSSSIKLINIISRISLSLFPFFMQKILVSGFSRSAAYIGYLTLLLPVVLGLVTVIASIERTPISGRIRTLLISQDEESKIMSSIMRLTKGGYVATTDKDWLKILKQLLNEENTEHNTLLGSKVLDFDSDWRVRWCYVTLAALENHLSELTGLDENYDPQNVNKIRAPPLNYALEPRIPTSNSTETTNLNSTRYSLLIVDRPEKNAFSFGFAPQAGYAMASPGVIVVFTGFLNSLLGTDNNFENISPTREQTEKLATLLSHELSHLLLSHTMESYASSGLLWKQVERLATDFVRTITFPITAIFGPFVNDAIGVVMQNPVDNESGDTVLSSLLGSCSNRVMELEADRVGLRLLANADIDPRVALKFWEDRLSIDERDGGTFAEYPEEEGRVMMTFTRLFNPHSAHLAHEDGIPGLLRSHPVDKERVASIREELSRWHLS